MRFVLAAVVEWVLLECACRDVRAEAQRCVLHMFYMCVSIFFGQFFMLAYLERIEWGFKPFISA